MSGHESPSSRLTVLVVEDEFLIGMEMQDLLIANGYEVIGPVATVSAALAVLATGSLDACLLDVNLRGEHSAPVAQALKEKKVPFLRSSAYRRETLDEQDAFAGVTNIGKPTTPNRLLSSLTALLKS